MALSIQSNTFSAAEITALMRAGFLTSTVQGLNSANLFTGTDTGSSGSLTSIPTISRAASGSMAAVGGEGAIYCVGGRGGIRRSSSQLEKSPAQKSFEALGEGVELRLSLPGTGAYLKVGLFSVLCFPDLSSFISRKTCSTTNTLLSTSIRLQILSCKSTSIVLEKR